MKRVTKKRAALGPQELRAVRKSVREHFLRRADRGATRAARRGDARAELRLAPMTRDRLEAIRRRGKVARGVDPVTVLALVEEIERLRAWLERIAKSSLDPRSSARAALRGGFPARAGR